MDQYGQMVDLGYETYNSILNLGSLSLIFALYFFKIIYLVVILFLTRCTTKY